MQGKANVCSNALLLELKQVLMVVYHICISYFMKIRWFINQKMYIDKTQFQRYTNNNYERNAKKRISSNHGNEQKVVG